jgi:hypothetical protein
MILESGLGNGKLAGVDNDNRLLTASFNIPFPHLIAKDYNRSFSVVGTCTPANGSVVPLHLRNDNATDLVVINRVTVQVISEGTFPNAGEFFSFEVDSDYSTGGNVAIPVNASAGATTISNVSATAGNPTVGAGGEVERYYPPNAGFGTEIVLEGSALLLPGRGACVRYTGVGTAGVVKASVGFVIVSQAGEGYSG